ncbi:MAG: hypothetical protein DME99_12575 [Verrucomicrobia bacterium]|nr:MAG: hypothetical protein DME99_12575 [Verrucomicrobiota bacterium]
MTLALTTFVIPSAVEESLISKKLTSRDVSISLDMTTGDECAKALNVSGISKAKALSGRQTTRHSDRSEAESKNPVVLRLRFYRESPRLHSE